ncbi:M50 family metallopeptidase [Streptomyces sp. NBC_01622]|uniref:hypothetical protein n=1 Tax=Streptomyces sp. NBC_01622 TaxID=2975903 RepID=UPI00386D182A|nr:M50 family metallopeptidase [Streptomyces sp. NBC_01622]
MPQRVAIADSAHRAHLVGNPNSQLWLTAVHEAGHAVVCLAVGGAFRSATLRKSEYGTVAGHVRVTRCPSPRLEAIVTLAGFAAESIADTCGIEELEQAREEIPEGMIALPRSYRRAKGDFDDVRELAKEHGLAPHDVLDSAAVAAHVLYPLIEVAAAALMEPKPLRALSELEIEAAVGIRPAPWFLAAERLLDVETPTGATPDEWLVRYVKGRLG